MQRKRILELLTVALIATNEVSLLELNDKKLDEVVGGSLTVPTNLNLDKNGKIILWDEKKLNIPKIKNHR